MSSLLSELGQSAANLPAEAVAFALGIAAGRALEAPGTEIAQKTWEGLQVKAVAPETAASIVAQNVEPESWGEGEAAQYGIKADRFQALVQDVLVAPGFGELLRMLRRGTISGDDLTHGFRKLKLETQWDTALTDLQSERIDPAVVATSIQRGIITDPGYLPTQIDFSGADVPEPAASQIDAVKEAAASGISSDRLAVLTRIVGLPPAPGELLQLLNRGHINEASYRMGIAEGNTRNEWAPFLEQLRRRLLTPHEYAELQLRGYLGQADRDTGAALSGMLPADTQLLYDVLGRAPSLHTVVTGIARGGVYNGATDQIPLEYLQAMQRSNLRPEWYNIAYSARYNYPSAFVIRALATGGEWSADTTKQVLLDIGWKPDIVDETVQAWYGTTTSSTDKHVTKAETTAWSKAQASYIAEESTVADVQPIFAALAIPDAAQTRIVSLWDETRALIRKQLSPAQVKKAIGQPGKDAAWATQELLDRGYSADDAATFLAE